MRPSLSSPLNSTRSVAAAVDSRRDRKAAAKNVLGFLLKRLKSIYPVYVAGFVATLAVSSQSPPQAWRACTDLLLLQAWNPAWAESAVMPHAWFLSAIVPCWMLHSVIFHRVEVASTRVLLACCAIVSAMPTVVFGILPMTVGCWWCGHAFGQYESTVDFVVVFLKFHPLAYLPTYICGVISAVLASRWKRAQGASETEDGSLAAAFIGFGTTFGTAGLLACFAIARNAGFQGAKLGFRLGMLLPFHALLLVGLAVGNAHDPVRRIFEMRLFQEVGSISYSQVCWHWYLRWFLANVFLDMLSVFLNSTFFNLFGFISGTAILITCFGYGAFQIVLW